MRIIIETQSEGRILLEPEKLNEIEDKQQDQQGSQESAIDGGPPSADLMNAMTGATSDVEDEDLQEDSADFSNIEEPSSFH